MHALPLVEPAYCTCPPYAETFGPEVADLAALAGFAPDPEQELALNSLFGINSDGKPVTFEFCVICARQNLKTGFLKQATLGWLFVTEQKLITWSAHEMDTTREAFRDLGYLIENTPSLSKRLLPGPTNGIFRGNGSEAVELAPSKACPEGQRVKFKARTNGGGRGLTGDKVILDEGYALKKEHMGSLLPTLSTRPEAQVVIASSAGQAGSEVLRGIRDRGRPGRSPRLGYIEFCAPEYLCELGADCPGDGDGQCRYEHVPLCEFGENCTHALGTPGCAADNLDYVRMANPALERRITIQYIEDEREALPPDEFVRERLGWWDPADLDEGPLISKDMWRTLGDPESTPVDKVSFGIYVNKAQTRAAIGIAAYRADGLYHVGVVPAERGGELAYAPGMGWIPDRAKELFDTWSPCALVIDERSEAGALITDIEKLTGSLVTTTNATGMAQACGKFYAATRDREIRHRGSRPLEDSVTAGKRRDLADAWAWDRKDPSCDITELVAVTLALHGLIVHGQPRETEVWGFFT